MGRSLVSSSTYSRARPDNLDRRRLRCRSNWPETVTWTPPNLQLPTFPRSQDPDVVWIKSHHIGLPALGETTEPIGDAQKQRGLIRGVAQCSWKGHAEELNAVADGTCHIKGRARNCAASVMQNSPRVAICSPYRGKVDRVPPAGGIASVTSIGCAKAMR